MSTPASHTLVNFRAGTSLLESFDRVCSLSGRTRTQVLAEMMRQRVTTAGPRLTAKLEAHQRIDERLKAVTEQVSPKVPAEPRREWSAEIRNRLLPFSAFLDDGS